MLSLWRNKFCYKLLIYPLFIENISIYTSIYDDSYEYVCIFVLPSKSTWPKVFLMLSAPHWTVSEKIYFNTMNFFVSLLSLHCHGSEASWLGSLCVTCPWVLHAQAWISLPLSTSGCSQPSPPPVGFPGLEVLSLLLIIHLPAQLTDVGLLCHLSCRPVVYI